MAAAGLKDYDVVMGKWKFFRNFTRLEASK